MWEFILKGGWLMVPIFLCSLFAVAIIIERIIFFFSISRLNGPSILSRIFMCIRKNKIAEAIDLCDKKPFFITNILKAGLIHYEESKETMKEAMENTSLYEIPKLEKNLHFLSTLAHISPLIGLLGTVVGLVKCFYIIETKTVNVGLVNPADLAGGIWEALLTTVAGLCVAIPSYIFYNYFVHRVNFSALEAGRAATEFLELVTQRRYAGEI